MLKILKTLVFSYLCAILCSGCSDARALSLEEKVGQLLMVHFHGEVANEDARTLIQDTKVGGFIYYEWANGLNSPQQVRTLSTSLQELTRSNPTPIPLLIAVDQEGGIVARLNKGFTKFPGNKALGETGDPQLARSVAFAIGQELQAVGINMNLAPVVDANINPRNPVIGVRSFGENPEIVIVFGQNALNGYREARIITTLKHFPGHGDVVIDPHEGLPVVDKTIQELRQVELLPFARLAASADAIMTAHILVPALDSENCSTLSKKTLTYLRDTIGFQGVIIADSLVMEGVTKQCNDSVDEAAIQALEAGCDILMLGGKLLSGEKNGFELSVSDVQRIHGSIVNAVKSGRISESRLNQAVERILLLKKRCTASIADNIPLTEIVNTPEHQAIAKEVASRAFKTTRKEGFSISPIKEKKIVVFAPQPLKNNIDETSLLRIGSSTNSYFFGLNPSSVEIDTAKQRAGNADVLFVCSYNAWKNPSQGTLVQSLIDTRKPVVLVVTRDPLDASLFPEAGLVFRTFSPTPPSIQAVCDELKRLFL